MSAPSAPPSLASARFRSAPDRFSTLVYALAGLALVVEVVAFFWLDLL